MSVSKIKKASLKDVAQAFGLGMKPWRWMGWSAILLMIVSNILAVIQPLYYKRFFDIVTAPTGDPIPELTWIIIMVLIIHGGSWLAFRSGLFLLNYFESSVMARLKQISFDNILYHSYSFFTNTFTGALVQKVNRFSRAFEKLFDNFAFNFLPLVVNIIGAIIVVYREQPMLAWIMIGWLIIVLNSNYWFYRWKVKYDLRSAEADSATTALLADAVTNHQTVSTFVGADHESASFKDISDKQARIMRFSWNLSSIVDSIQGLFVILVEFFVFYYGIRLWRQGAITVGTFVLIQTYILSLASRLWSFGQIVRNVYEGFADSEEMVRILILPHEVRDSKKAPALRFKKGTIDFKNLSFAFNDGRPVLKNISLKVRGGEKLAIIGPSGSGKSTLVRLILRMYNLKKGCILIDGQDIQKITQDSLRRLVSYVPQDPVLFHRTLMENIRYGRRDATDQEVIEAAKLAHCDEFIRQLPLQYETLVGERGIKLSGGERQRIAIARAMLKNAPILILDEATSSLDSHSEALIREALNALMKGRTVLVIAHRLSTIRQMDRIVVVENGVIVEEGSHQTLLEQDAGLYKRLWDLQAGGFIKN